VCDYLDMTETGIVALVGVAATLLSGLGAAWLTNRSARQRELEQRASLLQAEVRALIVEILVAARGLGEASAGISAGLAVMSSKEKFQKMLVELLNDSNSGKDFARYGEDLHTRLTDAQLRLTAGPVRDAVDAMTGLMLRWWEEVITPISEDFQGEHPSADRRMRISSRYTEQWAAMIRTVERTAQLELPKIAWQRVGA
jgi:hypothetical protein